MNLLYGMVLIGFAQMGRASNRWVWSNNNRAAHARYDVTEEPGAEIGPNFKPPTNNYPSNGRPFAPVQQGSGFGYKYPGSGPGVVLAGPVPSWSRRPILEKFDRCKCAESFNCNTPGISYGHCDVGKQYCCYRTRENNIIGTPILPSSIQNGILAGPGGPVDVPPYLLQ